VGRVAELGFFGEVKGLSMKTYLRVMNPIVAALVLLLCLWAAFFEKGAFTPSGVWQGGIPMYFVAKGLFCSSTLFIIGRTLLVLLAKVEDGSGKQ
jgi:hypothetical protein